MRYIVIVIIVLSVGFGIYCMGHASDAKPVVSSPSSLVADAISTDLDFKTRAGLEVRILSQDRDFKQLLAMGTAVDEETAKTELKSYEELQQDVAKGKEDLVRTGSSAQSVDAWLAKLNWPEVGDLADQVRSKVQQSAAGQ
jgi:hypothetical protein